jgi:bifunctional N6-L-threonylcarbamoyladenine synthase / protein kinase Bud32
MQTIAEGAEARLYTITREGERVLVKERIAKEYRETALDVQIRKQRTNREEKLLQTAARIGIRVPHVLEKTEFSIIMEYLRGKTLRDTLDENRLGLCTQLGEIVARLHAQAIIHGDLTTSNCIVEQDTLVLFDFGLGYTSEKAEDRAVDLLNLKKTLLATHSELFENAWNKILAGYTGAGGTQTVLNQLEKIEQRGRYKSGP